MRWLVTFSSATADDQWKAVLDQLACRMDEDAEPVPFDAEFVVEVEGPDDLPEVARGSPLVLAVHPSSDMNLYQ